MGQLSRYARMTILAAAVSVRYVSAHRWSSGRQAPAGAIGEMRDQISPSASPAGMGGSMISIPGCEPWRHGCRRRWSGEAWAENVGAGVNLGLTRRSRAPPPRTPQRSIRIDHRLGPRPILRRYHSCPAPDVLNIARYKHDASLAPTRRGPNARTPHIRAHVVKAAKTLTLAATSPRPRQAHNIASSP